MEFIVTSYRRRLSCADKDDSLPPMPEKSKSMFDVPCGLP